MKKICISSTIDEFRPNIQDKNAIVFFVSSAIHTFSNSIFSPKVRLTQTIKSLESIKKYFPKAIIILSEANSITKKDRDILFPYLDYFVSFATKNFMKILGKNGGEKYMSYEVARRLSNCNYKILFKLSGRYYLTKDFNPNTFFNDKICLRRAIWGPERLCMNTTLYSIPKCQYNNYINALYASFFSINDIEHSLYQNLKPGSFIELKKLNVHGLLPDNSLLDC